LLVARPPSARINESYQNKPLNHPKFRELSSYTLSFAE
jgi:hypothetical protein